MFPERYFVRGQYHPVDRQSKAELCSFSRTFRFYPDLPPNILNNFFGQWQTQALHLPGKIFFHLGKPLKDTIIILRRDSAVIFSYFFIDNICFVCNYETSFTIRNRFA